MEKRPSVSALLTTFKEAREAPFFQLEQEDPFKLQDCFKAACFAFEPQLLQLPQWAFAVAVMAKVIKDTPAILAAR
jgi:hypothetical protein